MRITELRAKLRDYFPDSDTYSQDVVLSALGGVTVNEAITRGDEPGEIWKAVLMHNPQMPSKFR
ncbi:MAG: DUF3046 domain-containing protein [Actinobacteria bacterium]|nr:DUF3046 domain-containing protein [Actinomycetota bacterium]